MTDANDDDARDRSFDERVRDRYRESQPRDPAAESRLLERLDSPPPPPRRGGWFEPRGFVLRPAAAVALAGVTLAAALWAGSRLTGPAPGGVRAPTESLPQVGVTAGVPVTFVLRSSDAARVNLVGDFNSWDAEATPLTRDGTRDLWVVELNLPRGVHNYAFVLDGREWRPDPLAPLAADASFGGRTSVLVVEGANGL